jgi:hypothetical protein
MQFVDRNLTHNRLPILQIGFFAGGGWCGQRYSHVELRFSDYVVTSITKSPGVAYFIPGKRLSNPGYRCFFDVAVDPHVEEAMRDYAERFHEPFSSLSMFWNFTCGSCCCIRTRGTFCSAYICRILQVGGLCEALDPQTTSPDRLFRELSGDPRTVCSVNTMHFA